MLTKHNSRETHHTSVSGSPLQNLTGLNTMSASAASDELSSHFPVPGQGQSSAPTGIRGFPVNLHKDAVKHASL